MNMAVTKPAFGASQADRERMKLAAWEVYASIPHADIRIGWQEYLATVEAIDALPGRETVDG